MAKSVANRQPNKTPPPPQQQAKAPEEGKTGKTPKEPKPDKPVPVIKSGALSVDVGPMVLAGLSKSYEDENKAKALLSAVETKRFDLLAVMTQAIVKAAKADGSIDLSATFANDAKKMNVLNDQLGLALGFREVTVTKDAGGKEHKRIGYAKTVLKYFPGPKDKEDQGEYQRKSTLRSNFLHMLKKCAQASSAIVENDIVVKKDEKSGTLMVSGPKIQQQFGQDSVLLNDKLNIGEGESKITLKEKPSFTAMAKMGAAASGKVLPIRQDSRIQSGAVDPDTAIISICNTLVTALGKLQGHPMAKTIEALNSAKSAIDKITKNV